MEPILGRLGHQEEIQLPPPIPGLQLLERRRHLHRSAFPGQGGLVQEQQPGGVLSGRARAALQGSVAQGLEQDRRGAECQPRVHGRARQGHQGPEGLHLEVGRAGTGREVQDRLDTEPAGPGQVLGGHGAAGMETVERDLDIGTTSVCEHQEITP